MPREDERSVLEQGFENAHERIHDVADLQHELLDAAGHTRIDHRLLQIDLRLPKRRFGTRLFGRQQRGDASLRRKPRNQIETSEQKTARKLGGRFRLAGVEGLEPPTPGFGDRCSSQLSYTPTESACGGPKARRERDMPDG
jgi:hypothetical protein